MENKTNNTKQAFWAGLGGLLSFSIALLSSMILSRYFAKNDYGTYRQVLYVYNSLLAVFTLGLPKCFSYFLPRLPKTEAKSLIKKINNILYLLGLLFTIIIFIASNYISEALKNPDLAYALRIFSVVPFLMLPTMGLESILATYRKTHLVAIYTVSTRILIFLFVVIPVVVFKGTYIHAIYGFVVASACTFALASYLKFFPIKKENHINCSVNYKEIFQFSIPLLYASIWGMITLSADQFFISRFFGNEVFAEFSNGSLQLPFVGMVVGSTTLVLAPIFSKQVHENKEDKHDILILWNNVFEKTVKLIYPLVLFFIVFADYVMVVLYGNAYNASGDYFRIKLFVNFFNIISFAPLIMASGATKFYAKAQMYSAIILILLEYSSILVFNSPLAVISVSVICQIGRVLVFMNFISKFLKVSILKLFPIRLISLILLPSLAMLLLLRYVFTSLFLLEGLSLLVISFLLYGIIYFIWSYFIKIDYLNIIKPLLQKIK